MLRGRRPKHVYIGIDPGQQGAIAVMDEDGKILFNTYDMPLRAEKGIDGLELYRFLSQIQFIYKDRMFCMLEQAQSMPSMDSQAVFNYGTGFGKIVAVLEILGVPYQPVRPHVWKKEFSLNKEKGKTMTTKDKKGASVAMAQKLFPNQELQTPKGRMLDGRAEALLICEYGRRTKG